MPRLLLLEPQTWREQVERVYGILQHNVVGEAAAGGMLARAARAHGRLQERCNKAGLRIVYQQRIATRHSHALAGDSVCPTNVDDCRIACFKSKHQL